MPEPLPQYVIVAVDTLEPLYYSADLGWTSLDECDVFCSEDREYTPLPEGGEWHLLSLVQEEQVWKRRT